LIRIKTTVKGESDTQPFTKVFEYKDEDEPIFLNLIATIKDKLSKNLKLNTQEALLAYTAYLVSEIRADRSELGIIKNASKVLTRDNVLIGVPETLREIKFDVTIDNMPHKIIQILEPIPTVNYIM
jgi:urease subunit gamma